MNNTTKNPVYLLMIILLLIEVGHYNNVDSVRSQVDASVQTLKNVNVEGKFFGVCIDPLKEK